MDELVERASSLCRAGERAILGICGPPGSGKSTLAVRIEATLNEGREVDSPRCRSVPMDGFHLSDDVLARLGRSDRKGAIDTFDGHGYVSLLRRLRSERDHPVFAPSFHRDLEQPIAAGILVEPSVELVVTEGNYLLVDLAPWRSVRAALDEVWFCQLDSETRVERLVARHVEFGKAPDEARRWVERVDEANAILIDATKEHADVVIDVLALEPRAN